MTLELINRLRQLDRETDELLRRAQEILADFPTDKLSPQSLALLQESPTDWTTTKERLLRAALTDNDQETIDFILDDIAHVMGRKNANRWKMEIEGKLVIESIEESNLNTS